MRADLATFKRGVMFAILSARVQFPRVPDQCEELHKLGKEAKCLWGHKFGAYVYLEEHANQIWQETIQEYNTAKALYILTRIPGLGIVKAAFVLQMLGHDIACLDVRNIERDGRNPDAFKIEKKHDKQFRIRIAKYISETQGKAQFYWDRWCMEVAVSYGSTAEAISLDHVNAIVRKGLRGHSAAPMTTAEIPF